MTRNIGSRAIVPGSLAAVAKRENLTLAESFLSVDALILVDMSGSMASGDAPGGLSRYDAAERELRDLQAALPGKIGVVAFSTDVEFCPTGVPIRMGMGTNMAKALQFVKPADGLAKLVLISDGEPDSESETLRVARLFKHKIDTVYIGPERDHRGRRFLEQLANATGGQSLQSAAPGLLKNETLKLLQATVA